MSMTDPIADMLTRIRNGQTRAKPSVTCRRRSASSRSRRCSKNEGYIAAPSTAENVDGKDC